MCPYLKPLNPRSSPVSKTQHCSRVEYSLKEGVQQPILHSPQALLGKRGANSSFLFLLSLKAVVKAPWTYIPIQPTVGLVPTCQEGGICTLNLEFAARKTVISTRPIWSKILRQSPTFQSCSLRKEIAPTSSVSPILHLTVILFHPSPICLSSPNPSDRKSVV